MINVLMILNCDSNAVCTNTDESFNCTCNNGYTGDGFTCRGNSASSGGSSGSLEPLFLMPGSVPYSDMHDCLRANVNPSVYSQTP